VIHNSKFLADKVFLGGRVITMEDPLAARPLDLAVADGRILSLTDPGGLSGLIGPQTETFNVSGKTLMPGLVDSHQHLVRFGWNLESVDLSPAKVKNMAQLVSRLHRAAEKKPAGSWIFGWGYDHYQLEEGRHPTRQDLDRACPDHPVCLMRTCLHLMVVNSLALSLADITGATEDPEGGRIVRDPSGVPNGILLEKSAMELVDQVIPAPSSDDCARFLAAASKVLVGQGVTLTYEAGAGWWGNPNEAAGFQKAWQAGELAVPVCLGLKEDTYRLFPDEGGLGLFTGFGGDGLWIGSAKFVTDGGIGQQTAAVNEPFCNTGTKGILCQSYENLVKRMEKAHLAGFQIAVHAVGDRSLEMVVRAYRNILSRFPKSHRHRIEHATICPPELVPQIRRLGLSVVVNPAFIYYLGDSWIEPLGRERIEITIPIRRMLDQGLMVAGGSDRPVTEGNPWTGIWNAVQRTTLSGRKFSPAQEISVQEALKLYTINGAYVNYAEDRTGTLTPGKQADLIVLDRNPLDTAAADLKNIRVEMTLIKGRKVFQAD